MIRIRPVAIGDLPDVLDLVSDVLREHGLEFGVGSPTDDDLRQLPESYVTRGGAFWVAYAYDALLGTCGVIPIAPRTFELRKMYLRPASRGLGVGKRLLELAIEWTRSQGGTRMVLDTTESMTRAIAFYEANGFVRDDAWKRGARCTRGYVRALGNEA